MTSSTFRFLWRFPVFAFLWMALVSILWLPLQAEEIKAEAVLGHKDFVTPDCNDPALPPSATLCHGVGVTVDPRSGKLFVADGDNNRVLIWPSAASFSNGQRASVVLGKPDFTIDQTLPCPTTAESLCDPNSVVVDHHGNLYVADTDGNRILRYSPPFKNGMKANMVIGEPDFSTSACNSGATGLCSPRDLAIDEDGNLIVVDSDNNRIVVFKSPLHNSKAAALVIGQANFDDNSCNRGQSAPSANTLCGPKGMARDSAGNLYVAED